MIVGDLTAGSRNQLEKAPPRYCTSTSPKIPEKFRYHYFSRGPGSPPAPPFDVYHPFDLKIMEDASKKYSTAASGAETTEREKALRQGEICRGNSFPERGDRRHHHRHGLHRDHHQHHPHRQHHHTHSSTPFRCCI